MPRITIGLPVFNGGDLVGPTIESLLAQTFADFELLLCDNASTDGTAELCAAFAEADPRVRFVPSDRNRGASWNFNRAFELAGGEYFKWAAHDDLCEPRFLEACIQRLDAEPELVACHTRSDEIDPEGRVLRQLITPTGIGADRPSERFASALRGFNLLVFGVIRRDVLARTGLMGAYVGSDTVLVGELALLGPMAEVDEVLFHRMEHPGTSQNAYDKWELAEWFDASRAGRSGFPSWRMLGEMIRAVDRRDLPLAERLACYRVIGPWASPGRLGRDLFEASKWAMRRTPAGAKAVDQVKRVVKRPDPHSEGRRETVHR